MRRQHGVGVRAALPARDGGPTLIQRRQMLALLTGAASLAVASASLAAPTDGREPHVLPPELGPILADIQKSVAASDPNRPLARAQIAVLADQVRFVHPQTGESLLVLTEHLASPWFAWSLLRVPSADAQRVVDLLGRRLEHSPWRAASSLGMAPGPAVSLRDPWQGEPTRPVAFALGTAALVWSAIGYALVLALRSRRSEVASEPTNSPNSSP